MSDENVFQRMDEEERVYAPEELAPDDPERAHAGDDEDLGPTIGYAAVPNPAPNSGTTNGVLPIGIVAPLNRVDEGGPTQADDADPEARDQP